MHQSNQPEMSQEKRELFALLTLLRGTLNDAEKVISGVLDRNEAFDIPQKAYMMSPAAGLEYSLSVIDYIRFGLEGLKEGQAFATVNVVKDPRRLSVMQDFIKMRFNLMAEPKKPLPNSLPPQL